MFKKLILLLLCSVNLYAAEPSKTSFFSLEGDPVIEGIGLVILSYIAYVYVPQQVKALETQDEKEQKETITSLNRLAAAVVATVCLYGFTKIYFASKELYDYLYPSEERKAYLQALAKKNKIFDAEEALLTCLMKSNETPRNESGYPIACEKLADALLAADGQAELNELMGRFKRVYGA